MRLRDDIRRWVPEIATVAALALIAGLAARPYLRADIYVWGDSPGQFMRLWYPLTVSVPEHLRLIDWNPFWYAGYPELQFYPPGFVLVGLMLYALTLGQLSPEYVYNILLALALVLPLFSSYTFLRVVLAPLGVWHSRLAGVTGGLIALSFPVQWGGTQAITIGLVGERLAFGMVPLVLLAGWKLVEQPSVGRLATASAGLALLTLLHPFHAPAVVLAAGFYALAHAVQSWRLDPPGARDGELARWGWLAAWIALSLGLTAWWLVPLVMRRVYAAPLVRASLVETIGWLSARPMFQLLPMALPALFLLLYPSRRIRSTIGALSLLLPTLVAGIMGIYLILFRAFGITELDPVRFAAEFYLTTILLVAAGIALLFTRHAWHRPLIGVVLASTMLYNGAILLPKLEPGLVGPTNVPATARLSGVLDHPAFDGLWPALQRGPEAQGRVLFTSYYLRLEWPDGTVTPTALKSMTPYLSGREIVGGTFSHWSPVARLLWAGDPWVDVLPERVEREDDITFLGEQWSKLDDETLYALVRALNITTVVAGIDDFNARTRLDAAPQFQSYWNNGYFYLYRVLDVPPAWAEAEGAEVEVVERLPRLWRIHVSEASEGTEMLVKMTAYPLWHADVAGRELPVHADGRALMRVALPAGDSYTVTLTYREGWAEIIGGVVTLLSVLIVGAGVIVDRRR